MAKRYTRQEIHLRIGAQLRQQHPIVISGAGTGISAKFAEKGGADMIGIYNSGRFRMDGHNSGCGQMYFSSANEEILKLAKRIMPVIHEVPVIAGIAGNDPSIDMEIYFRTLQFYGFSAVMNFPTCGDFLGFLQTTTEEMDEYGIGFQQEADALALAREMGMFTLGYAFTLEQAEKLGKAGIDVLICHLGLTQGGIGGPAAGECSVSLESAAKTVTEFEAAAKKYNKDILLMAHGGPISSPEDTKYIYAHTNSIGFLGASSIERIPVEQPILEAVKQFKDIVME
ncbi:phosphoenolpyruvate hydrolase family protein [Lactonifactor longoviformis]|uniref:Transcriptional regulator n=1 Tax=Lactonifactor longoviformis DSM 17459 TaxID=1122155 RepID=A0A1M4URP8_9CLOT|nr:phosphoenolpyruvate hydrolase family protein [Lactonifactor longoviformis]POP31941.1 phosphoenolpyruvate hydrolase family protein [Lactonifactor longoviformis]SHE59280.1 transcriptional regulator [Lactonifactor longoviformis DSM 17459]